MKETKSPIHERQQPEPNSMTSAASSSVGDIYYEFTERDKYRSVHPPQLIAHQCHDHRDTQYVAYDYPRHDRAISSGHLRHDEGKLSIRGREIHGDHQTGSGQNTDDSKDSGNFFEIASSADCYDAQNLWPMSSNSTRNNGSVGYTDFPLADAPNCVCATNFNVDGRTWFSTKDIINQFLKKSEGMTWEYKDLEHLWMCDYLNGPRQADCLLQIRAYLDPTAGCVLIEMQKLRGDDSLFYQLYQSLLNEICSNGQQPSTSQHDRSIQSSSSHVVRSDCNIEFLLVPVLEMIQSDYPDMQAEALRLTCELSANVKLDHAYCPEAGMNSFAGETTRTQMLRLGYLAVLIDLVCKCFAEDANGVVSHGPHLTGHRALAGIYNLSTEREGFPQMVRDTQNSKMFFRLLHRISKVGVSGHSSQLQLLCLEMTKFS